MVHTHIFKESIPGRKLRDDLCRRSRVHFNYSHEVIFMIHPKGVDELTQKLHDVSDPESQEYGKHLTRTEVVTMTANTVGRDAVVMYLQLNHATVVSQTLDGNYVTALATIEVWERTFDTEFFMFHQTHSNGYVKEVVRAEGYSIPKELSEHVKYVLKVVDIPFPVRRRSLSSSSMKRVDQPSPKRSRPDKRNTESASESLLSLKRMVTPDKIRSYYNMTNYEGSEYSVQAVYASGGQNISPLDLKLFQEEFSIVQDVIPIRGHANHTVCTVESLLCAESNLDIQYIMGISPMSPTFHWYYPGDFADWLIEISNTVDPPLVLSISYGSQEYRVTKAEHYAFDYEAIKLGVVGVSIFVAAGDDGANGSEAKYLGPGSCQYLPEWPCSSPYVISVGATSGLEMNPPMAESVAQSDVNGAITSGGGFSNHYPRPSWQSDAVSAYLTGSSAPGRSPLLGYNRNGRGYPDISAAGVSYATYIGGALWYLSGTSASTPVIAAMISNINASRRKNGKGSVGWLNPALYKYASEFINDVTVGHNKCVAGGAVCCRTGFYATAGWDPTTGLGTPDYGKMHQILVSLGSEINGAFDAPTAAPTVLLKDQPSTQPTSRPSVPTHTPTARPSGPSFSPSFIPTRAPVVSRSPTLRPTRRPTLGPTISISPSIGPTKIHITEASEAIVVISVVSSLGCVVVVAFMVGVLLYLKKHTRQQSVPAVYMGTDIVFPSTAYLSHLDSIPQILPAASHIDDPCSPRFSLHRQSSTIPVNT